MEFIPKYQYKIILIRTIGGLVFTEIAEFLEFLVKTVKSQFKYGVDKLKSKIIKKDD